MSKGLLLSNLGIHYLKGVPKYCFLIKVCCKSKDTFFYILKVIAIFACFFLVCIWNVFIPGLFPKRIQSSIPGEDIQNNGNKIRIERGENQDQWKWKEGWTRCCYQIPKFDSNFPEAKARRETSFHCSKCTSELLVPRGTLLPDEFW